MHGVRGMFRQLGAVLTALFQVSTGPPIGSHQVHPKPRHATRDRRPPARGGGRGRACKDDAGAQVIPVGRIGRPGLPASRVFGAAPGPGPHRDGRIRIGIQRGVDLARHSSCSQKDQRDKRHVAGPDRSVLQKRNQHPLDAGPPARAQALRRGPGGRQRLHRHRAGARGVAVRPDPHEASPQVRSRYRHRGRSLQGDDIPALDVGHPPRPQARKPTHVRRADAVRPATYRESGRFRPRSRPGYSTDNDRGHRNQPVHCTGGTPK
mmetsp:Transcript_61742/g.147661  ORF Transcript_61742/g.147661 Transcript_61742/m.147661 type:complete len:264 (+) Transcript_61742:244-1035(+)